MKVPKKYNSTHYDNDFPRPLTNHRHARDRTQRDARGGAGGAICDYSLFRISPCGNPCELSCRQKTKSRHFLLLQVSLDYTSLAAGRARDMRTLLLCDALVTKAACRNLRCTNQQAWGGNKKHTPSGNLERRHSLVSELQ